MLLLVDVGNTQTEIGAYERSGDKGFVANWRISTVPQQSADDLISRIAPLFQQAKIDQGSICGAAIACVVPSLHISWDHACVKMFGFEPLHCTMSLAQDLGLFNADYPNPSEIGSDRIADAIAARALHGFPCVVIDFGTATNIEVVGRDGRFKGGIIAPGIMTGANALFKNAAQIPSISITAPDNVVGKSTAEAIQSGLIFGEVGRVDGLLDRIFEELGGECEVVTTGGLCHTVSRLLRHVADVRPELTLEGLRILAEAANGDAAYRL